ncbi:MAG: hypothetical protein A2516_04600 [Alphaproteobacteria bacterium RIFOXYD12_FULL_60_8]|nr:MAG: hypothetical protein A2516_04600 [Alphaproteobacteria bacterium RIFOXYD12_FULL_60_8]
MPQPVFQRPSAFARFNLWLLLTFLVGGAAMVGAVYIEMRREALNDAEATARVLLDHNLAFHSYFNSVLKPHVFAFSDKINGKGYFDPTWMSSTYAVREVDKTFKTNSPANYYYKEAAINARSPANEADEWEREFIKRLNTDPVLTVESNIREMNGEPYFVVLRRGESMEQNCLRCHDTPQKAPAGLVEIYGPERSFGRKVGEVVSAISIRVPLAEAYARNTQVSLLLSGILLAVLACVFVLQRVLTKRMFASPLLSLEAQSRALAASPDRLGEQLDLPQGREFAALTEAFNTMSAKLGEDAAAKNHLLDELLSTHAELEQFTHVASHDLQEPLRMVVSYVQLLQKRYQDQLDQDAQEYMGFAVEGAVRMRDLISDLLEYSRAGDHARELTPVRSADCLAEALDRISKSLEERGAKVVVENMPIVRADPAQLIKLFHNLLTNALKYSRAEVVPEIHVTAEAEGEGMWRICVRDNGVGIAPEYWTRIFSVFQRLHPRGAYPGTGIGLAVCKKILERHGGRIWVESTPGVGSLFCFTLLDGEGHRP